MTPPFFFVGRTSHNATRAIETHPRVIHDYGTAVNISHIHHVDVEHGAVVEECAASPFPASETNSGVTEAVVNASVETNVRSPVSSVPTVETTFVAPIAGRPEHADGRNDPRARNPVVAAVFIPRPVAWRPEIAGAGADRLRIHRQCRRSDAHRDANSNFRGRWNGDRHHQKSHHDTENEPKCETRAFHFHFPFVEPN